MGNSKFSNLRPLSWLLRVPLFYKIVLVNSAVFALGWAVGTQVTIWHVRNFPDASHWDLIVLFFVGGVIVGCLMNRVVLKIVLIPLDRLQAAIDDVQRGRTGIQIKVGRISDERFDRLITEFNQMLAAQEKNSLQLHRQSGKILQAQEEERRRVARELHDETSQSLTSLLVRLRMLERTQNPEEAHQQVRELRALTAHVMDEIHRIALELRPKILDDLGLEAALGWQVDEFNKANPSQASLHISRLEKRLPNTLELIFYRVVQEALTNIARHAHAQHVDVGLKLEGDNAILEVWDNGVGFDITYKLARSYHGLGLLGMRERLSLAGGELRVDAQPGKGTHIIASIPLLSSTFEGSLDEKDPRSTGR